MANTYYDSKLTAAEIEAVLEAIDGVIVPANNGKVLAINNGKIEARSVQWGGGEPVLEPLSVTANGDYTPEAGVDGFDEVHVSVPNSYSASDEGKVVSNGALVAQTARASQITQNGTYDTTLNDEVTVNVSGGGSAVIQPLSVTQNGTYNPPSGVDGYAPVTVNVSGGVSRKTQAEWDALSFSEKQALGLTVVGNLTDYSGEWFDYSIINYVIDFCSASGDGSVDTKTVYVDNFANYDRLAVFVAVNDNNTGAIEVDGVSQTVTKSGDVYFCATLIVPKASFLVTIGHGDGGSAMYSVAVFGISGLTSCTNYPAYVSGTSGTVNVANYHSAAIVDVMTDRVSGSCFFDGDEMVLAKIGRGYFGDLYHAFLFVYGISAGIKTLSGSSGVKCFQILGLDN